MKNRSFFKALIVDDEQHGRDQVAYHLNRHEDIRVIALVGSVDEAIIVIEKDLPDVTFLDIDMPGRNGFELVKELKGMRPMPEIVFVTAFDQYAIQAIKNAAFDYILKPIAKDEFDEVISRFRKEINERDQIKDVSELLTQLKKPEKLRFNQKGRTIFIDPGEIVYCKADGNYTEIFTGKNQSEIISHNLKEIQEVLSNGFQRLGRSMIINKELLSKIDRAHKVLEFQKNNQLIEVQVTSSQLQKL